MTAASQDEIGHQRHVESPIVCSLTRFGLRSRRHLIPAYRNYRSVVDSAKGVGTPGLLRCALLVENPTTFYSLSIWAREEAIAHFGTNVPRHVEAARDVFGRLAFDPDRGPELWSTRWRLVSTSNNLNWGDFDFRGVAPPDAS
jgi:hypothetical protein